MQMTVGCQQKQTSLLSISSTTAMALYPLLDRRAICNMSVNET